MRVSIKCCHYILSGYDGWYPRSSWLILATLVKWKAIRGRIGHLRYNSVVIRAPGQEGGQGMVDNPPGMKHRLMINLKEYAATCGVLVGLK
jgi:hypothetical protein